MTANILDASALLQRLPDILPVGKKRLESQQDAIAAMVHTVLTVLGFRLTGTDETGPTHATENNVLPEQWNQHAPSHYALKYKHEQSSLDFLVKVTKLGSRTLINSIAVETDKAVSLDIPTSDFTSPSFFPHEFSESSPPLVNGFISSNRVADFVSQFQLTTVQKLIPGLRKEGYTETAVETSAGPSQPRAPQRVPARPRPDQLPYFPGSLPAPAGLPSNPLEIGRRDLNPFPSNPFVPRPLFGGHGGDGMFVGPDHPIFGGGIRSPNQGGMGPWGGDGFLPPLGAPPGARFDPVGPAFGPNAPFPGHMPPGGRGGPFGGQDPDFDDFPPPGSRDMFS